jgi:hypothetical protein
MKRLAILVAPLLLLLVGRLPAAAHGGGQLVAGPIQAGPYMLSVWVNPPQPRAEEAVHYTIGLAAPEDGSPVLDAQVLITMRDVTSGMAPVSAAATTDQSINKLFYEADMRVDQPGHYLTTVAVSGPAGEGRHELELDVQEPSPLNYFLLGLAGLALVMVIAALRRRREQPA